jgi:adenine-specific DNA-methyltransferase
VSKHDIFDNILIHGDNLLALKALEQEFTGKIKCIFIDPPYNTGSAFEHYDDGIEHSLWLSLMRDRLEILHRLLSADGSLWITIDDNEAHYLKVLCDEVFGRNNFVANVLWQKSHTRENRTDISAVHDHVLVFARQREIFKNTRNPLPSSKSRLDRYTNPDNDPRGPWASLPAHAKAEKGRRRAQFFTVTTPSGRKVDPPPGRCWLYTEARFLEMIEDKRIWFGPDGGNTPRVNLNHSPATRTGGALSIRVKLQLVMCSDDGHEETVTDIVTLKKSHKRIEHLGLTLAETKQLLKTIQQRLLQQQVDAFLTSRSTCPAAAPHSRSKAIS